MKVFDHCRRRRRKKIPNLSNLEDHVNRVPPPLGIESSFSGRKGGRKSGTKENRIPSFHRGR